MTTIRLHLKKSAFPAIMTIISFVLFLGVYLLVTITAVEPYYLQGLIFAVPFVVFAIITFLTVKDKLKVTPSSIITGVLIPILGFAMLFCFVFLVFDAAATSTNDISKYERVLNMSGYPENNLINFFPSKIPQNATELEFHYHPGFLQGGEVFKLKYKTTAAEIQNHISEFSVNAEWIGTQKQGSEQDHVIGWATNYLYNDEYELPEDFIVYLLYSRPYQDNNWNHGEICLVTISAQRSEIIFYTDNW